MIQYDKSAFGLGLLFRLHGSAVYRSMIPGALSVGIVLRLRLVWVDNDSKFDESVLHPYAIGVLVSTLTFLLVFRVQQAYSRYWEACSAVYHMSSRWMDAVSHAAAYHMQCSHYNHIKPPSFIDYPELNRAYLTRSREQFLSEAEHRRLYNRAVHKSIEPPNSSYLTSETKLTIPPIPGSNPIKQTNASLSGNSTEMDDPTPLEGSARMDGNYGNLFPDGKATFFNPKHPEVRNPCGFAGTQGGRTPPLFLQELAHLTSLLTGVALSTLRNDVEGAESPLDIYEPGSPWPAVDPDHDRGDGNSVGLRFTAKQRFLNFLGVGRSPQQRTQHNAARPLPVLGGVSEGEIKFLQIARGPGAKTQLCWYWLSEFINREHLAGSLGQTGSPSTSRVMQFLGDGMLYYNHARKIMFIPFPFPHAQLSVFYVFASVPTIAVLMEQYTIELWVACVLSFLTVTCLTGIHEVARELENPFRNVPNEIPLVTLQAQFNETLVTMYAGYHPDHFWGDSVMGFTPMKPVPENGTRDEDKSGPAVSVGDNAAHKKTVRELKVLVHQQKLAMESQIKQMAERHKRELDRQQQQIDRIRADLGVGAAG